MSVVYSYDFTGTTGAAWSVEWATSSQPAGATVDISSNQGRMAVPSASQAARAILSGSSFSSANAEAVLTLAVPATPANGGTPQIQLRTSGDWLTSGGEVDSPTTGYKVVIFLASNQFAFYKQTGTGTSTQVGTTQSFTWTGGTTFNLAFRVEGTTISFWAWTGSRPGTATYSQTDSSVTGAGQCQLANLSQSAGTKTALLDSLTLDNLVTATNANAVAATGTGAALFDSGSSTSVTLEALDAITVTGTAYGVSKGANNDAAPTGVGAANNATVALPTPNPAVAASTGAANNPTVTRTGHGDPTAGAGTGTANNATISTTTGTVNASAQTATGAGSSTGISYLLDENGDPVLDENGQPIEDGYGLKVTIASNIPATTAAGAGNAAQSAVAPHAGIGASTGAAFAPAITTDNTTAVNPTEATSAGAAANAVSKVATTTPDLISAGVAAATTAVTVNASAAVAAGAVTDAVAVPQSAEAAATGEAFDAQVNVLSGNFISAAAIPIAATVPAATINVAVHATAAAAAGSTGGASPNSQNEPGQLVTVRDHGHTISAKEK